jgi:DNA-binding NarL/FixJ family response regulator
MLIEGTVAPDAIVIAQAYPGQFSAEAVDRLRRRAPLARIIGLLGSWCEGETRTGQPWPASVRVYWHQWQPTAAQELQLLAAGGCATWALPATASEEERVLARAEQHSEPRQGRIAIHAPQFDMGDWLASACGTRGYETVRLKRVGLEELGEVTAAVFDATHCLGGELDALRRLAGAISPAPLVALLDFPRVEDCTRASDAGAAAVLAKPFLLEDLFWQLEWLTEKRPSQV